MVDTLAAALAYSNGGLSVIPIGADGSKAPAVDSWKQFQRSPTDEAQIRRWFTDGKHGIGIVWGAVSGNGEVLDFDAPGLYDLFAAECRMHGLDPMIARMPLIETPSGGRHLIYRCADLVGRNRKLAQRQMCDGAVETLIETRGEGGYTLAPGSPEACHPDRKPYRFLRGRPGDIPTISAEEREVILSIAGSFNEYVKSSQIVEGSRPTRDDRGIRPGDEYNGRGDCHALLSRHGWTVVGTRGEATLWRRPGKTDAGISASTNYAGRGLFFVFSTNATPFEAERGYTPFAVYAVLESGGDFAAAAKALAAEGFGTQTAPAAPMNGHGNVSTGAARKPFAERVIDLADIEDPPSELPYLFGPYWLKGAQHWITGSTGIGKSTLAYNIAAALVEGNKLWGVPCQECSVLYVDLETGDVGRRLKVQRLYKDRTRPRGRLHFIGDTIKLPDELTQMLGYIKANGIELVLFDTARRCFSVKDENDNAEFYARIVPILDHLKQAGVATVTFGHPAKHEQGRARGAGAQEDAGDVNLSLTLHKGNISSPNAIVVLKVTKNRILGLDTPPLYLRRVGCDRFERVDGADSDETTDPPVSAKIRCRTDILDCLQRRAGDRIKHKEIVDRMRECGHSESTTNRTLKQLAEEEELDKTPAGYKLMDPFAG